MTLVEAQGILVGWSEVKLMHGLAMRFTDQGSVAWLSRSLAPDPRCNARWQTGKRVRCDCANMA
jgi:hypothetical protein